MKTEEKVVTQMSQTEESGDKAIGFLKVSITEKWREI